MAQIIEETEVPLTAKYTIVTYDEQRLERFQGDAGSVNQTVLVHPPTATVNVLDVYPEGGADGAFVARVVTMEPAIRTDDGVLVPMGHVAEIKAKALADEAKKDSLITPNSPEKTDG